MNDIPIFIINLARDKTRKMHMQKLCSKHNLLVEFVEAIDGKKLTKEKINSVYCAKKVIKKLGRELGKGEIACALSHQLIYQKMLNESIETALILEDDVFFNNTLLECLSQINKFPNNWEVMLLAHYYDSLLNAGTPHSFWYKQKLGDNIIIRRPATIAWGAYGYCISNKGAKKINEHLSNLMLPLDWYTGRSEYINLYIVERPIILIDKEMDKSSNLENERRLLRDELPIIITMLKIILKKLKLFTFIKFLCLYIYSLPARLKRLKIYE